MKAGLVGTLLDSPSLGGFLYPPSGQQYANVLATTPTAFIRHPLTTSLRLIIAPACELLLRRGPGGTDDNTTRVGPQVTIMASVPGALLRCSSPLSGRGSIGVNNGGIQPKNAPERRNTAEKRAGAQ